MRDAFLIRVRMGADLEALRREHGGVEDWHLTEIGWTAAQLAEHLPAIVAELTATDLCAA